MNRNEELNKIAQNLGATGYNPNSRNDIAAAIVNHLGGTADAGEPFNDLIQKWADIVDSRRYLRFDGVMSYGEFERAVTVETGGSVKLSLLSNDASALSSVFQAVDGADFAVQVGVDGVFLLGEQNRNSTLLNGVAVVHGSTPVPTENLSQLEVVNDGAPVTLKVFASASGTANHFSGVISNVEITDSSGEVIASCSISNPNTDTQPNLADPTNPLILHNVSRDDWFEDVDGRLLGVELAQQRLDFYDADIWTPSSLGVITAADAVASAGNGVFGIGSSGVTSTGRTYLISAKAETSAQGMSIKDSDDNAGTAPDIVVGVDIDASAIYSAVSTGVYFRASSADTGDEISVSRLSLREYIGDIQE